MRRFANIAVASTGERGRLQDRGSVGSHEEDAVRREEEVPLAGVQVQRVQCPPTRDEQARRHLPRLEDPRIGDRDRRTGKRRGKCLERAECLSRRIFPVQTDRCLVERNADDVEAGTRVLDRLASGHLAARHRFRPRAPGCRKDEENQGAETLHTAIVVAVAENSLQGVYCGGRRGLRSGADGFGLSDGERSPSFRQPFSRSHVSGVVVGGGPGKRFDSIGSDQPVNQVAEE